MRRLGTLATVVLLFLCCGCLPQSLHPLYNDSDLSYDPGLEGSWLSGEGDTWQFSQLSDWQYSLMHAEANAGTASFVCQLVELGGSRFLDLTPLERDLGNTLKSFSYVPVHTFWKIVRVDDSLRFDALDTDKLTNYLAAHPDELKFEWQGSEVNRLPLITASTEDLRAFLLRHMAEADFFLDPIELTREAAAPPP